MITIQKKPFGIDFIENNPVFVLRRNSESTTRVKCRFRYSHTSSNLSSFDLTPFMYYDFNDNGVVSVGTNILKGYFDSMELPRYDDGLSGCQIFNHNLYYRLEIYEIIGNTTSATPVLSPNLRMVNGFVEYHKQGDNFPDWVSNAQDQRVSSRTGFDTFGQNNNDVVTVFRGTEQYLYIQNYNNSSITVHPTLTVKMRDGETRLITQGTGIGFTSFSLPARGLLMLRCDLPAFGSIGVEISDVIEYTLRINYNAQTYISRTFVLLSDPYDMKNLMLKNSLNMYESFGIDNIKKDISIEGDSVTLGGVDDYNVYDSEILYTARTGLLNRKMLSIIHSGLLKSGNVLLEGEWASYISIVPGSWTVVDQKEDLIEVEFQYKLGRKIARPYGTHEVPGPVVGGNDPIRINTRITSEGIYNRQNSIL